MLLGGEVLDSLVGLEMILDIVDLTLLVDPLEGMGTVSIHESVAVWGTSVGEEDGDLMEGLRSVLPEVEDLVGISQIGQRVPLLGVQEVGELDGIVNEEYRCVVANHVVVSFLGVEFNGEATRIPDGIGGTSLTSYCRESQEKRSPLSNLVQKGGLGEGSDVVGDLENTVSS